MQIFLPKNQQNFYILCLSISGQFERPRKTHKLGFVSLPPPPLVGIFPSINVPSGNLFEYLAIYSSFSACAISSDTLASFPFTSSPHENELLPPPQQMKAKNWLFSLAPFVSNFFRFYSSIRSQNCDMSL